jgi:hypothetical protein
MATKKKKAVKKAAVKKAAVSAAANVLDGQTTLNTAYFVNNSTNGVVLDIIYGDPGQTAATVVSLDDLVIVPGNNGDININLGAGRDLIGKTLDITATVSDTSHTSNHTEMIIRLRGGAAFREFVLSDEVANEGDVVPYSAIIRFRNL